MRIRIAYGVKKTFSASCFQRFAEPWTLVEHCMIYFSDETLALFAMPIDENAVPTNAFHFDIIMRIAFDFLPELLCSFTTHFAHTQLFVRVRAFKRLDKTFHRTTTDSVKDKCIMIEVGQSIARPFAF